MSRNCKFRSNSGQSSRRGTGSNKASGPVGKKARVLQVWATWKHCNGCKLGMKGFLSCSASTLMKGDDINMKTRCTDHVVPGRASTSRFESWNEEGQLWRTPTAL